MKKASTNKQEKDVKLPKRNLDTMIDAIALSSPSGKMSKLARKTAKKRLSLALFGKSGLPQPKCPQPTEQEKMLRQAKCLRELADRGMCVKKYRREAEKLEQLAAEQQSGKEVKD